MQDKLQDKQKLRQVVEKSITTTMIGALAAFEQNFGGLWGMGVPETEELSEKQQFFLEAWEEARTRILDLGSNAIKISTRAINANDIRKKEFYQEFPE